MMRAQMQMKRFDGWLGRVAAAALMGALSVAPVPLVAQSPAAKPDKETAARVLQLIKEGNAAYKEERFDAAMRNYEQAYKLLPDPALLYRLGQTAERQGKPRVAIEYYERFVAALPADEVARKVNEERLPALREKLPARLVVRSEPEGAQVRLGSATGRVVGTTPFEGEVPAGTERIVLTLGGFKPVEQSVSLSPDEEQVLDVTLARRSLSDAGDAELEVGDTNGGDLPSATSNLTAWGLGTTLVGVGLLGVGGLFSGLQASATEDVNTYDKQAPGATKEELERLKDEARANHTTATILYFSGGAIAAAGVGLLVWDLAGGGSDTEGSIAVRPSVDPRGGAAVQIGGRF